MPPYTLNKYDDVKKQKKVERRDRAIMVLGVCLLYGIPLGFFLAEILK
jgi:hypothetical protein